MTVYADVLVALNIFFTYILLVCTRVFLKFPTNKFAVMSASLIGGFSSLIIFLEEQPLFLSVLFKIFSATVISSVAFLPKSIIAFFKGFLAFLGVSFLFGGIMYGVEIAFNPSNIMFFNGTVYFDVGITFLVGSSMVIYGGFLVTDYLIGKRQVHNTDFIVEIFYRDSSIKTTGFIDTGNNLMELGTGKPIIVSSLSAVAPLFNFEELGFFKSDSLSKIPGSLKKTFRLIPGKSIGGETLLKGFLPDKIIIKSQNKSYETDFIIVAVSPEGLSGGCFDVLLNENIFENVRREKING